MTSTTPSIASGETHSSRERFSCLIVDDDRDFAGMVRDIVREHGGEPRVCHSLREARGELATNRFSLVFLDNRLPDGTGYEFYAHVAQRCPQALVIMITGMPELSQAVELTRNGLFDYLTKPIGEADLNACLTRVTRRLARPAPAGDESVMVGDSPSIRGVIEPLKQMARHESATVLFLGETGTGKDLAARVLHKLTHPTLRGDEGYIAVNCAAIPQEMFESELFGSEKGAYTGADRKRIGLVEAAEGGTLFLDEVTEVPIQLQAKLLRFLESREYRLLGSTSTRRFTGRIVAATNRHLPDEVKQGRFREDLMYRLDVNSIRLPPLRERLADIEPLAHFLLDELCKRYDRRKPSLHPDDLQALKRHSFPGNVRELRNLLERSLLRAPDEQTWLRLDLSWLRDRSQTPLTTTDAPSGAPGGPARELPLLDQQEYESIRKILTEENGAIRRSAQRLGITHQALLRRLQKWPELRQLTSNDAG